MINKKFWKTILFSTSILSVTVATALVSCGHKNTGPDDEDIWNKFKADAAKETIYNIVASDPPKIWEGLTDFEFIQKPVANNIFHWLTAVVREKAQNNDATFQVNYDKGETYNKSLWKCEFEPINPDSGWIFFKKEAINETVENIAAANTPEIWKGESGFTPKGDPIVNESYRTITRTVSLHKLNDEATFTISYKRLTDYSYKNWVCTRQPHDDQWNAFKAKAIKETAKNIVAADTPTIWKGFSNFQFTNKDKPFVVDDTNNTITAEILSTDAGKTATFSIKYIKAGVYASKNWKCVVQPKKPFVPSGFGKFKSTPYINIENLNSTVNPISPNLIYNSFGVHQLIIMGANVYNFNGVKTLGWNSYTPLTSRTSKEATWIYKYEALGGRIGISFGGILGDKNNTAPWDTLNATAMSKEFIDVAVRLYDMEVLDFDIEPGHDFNLAKMNILVDGINKTTDALPHLEVSLTISSGPMTAGINFWGSYIDHSRTAIPAFKRLKKVPIINPMVFDFGTSFIPFRPNYLTLIKNTISQTSTYFSKIYNINVQTFFSNHLEATTMIGRSDQGHNSEMLDISSATNLAKYCHNHSLLRMSYWDINRDFPGKHNPASGTNNGTKNPAGSYSKVNVKYFEN